jgi:hypothetical protein
MNPSAAVPAAAFAFPSLIVPPAGRTVRVPWCACVGRAAAVRRHLLPPECTFRTAAPHAGGRSGGCRGRGRAGCGAYAPPGSGDPGGQPFGVSEVSNRHRVLARRPGSGPVGWRFAPAPVYI